MHIRFRLNRYRRVAGIAAAGMLALLSSGCGGVFSPPENTSEGIPLATLVGGPPATSNTATPREKLTPSGVPATDGVIVQAGDSIGVGLGADDWAAIQHLGLPPGIAIHNVSVSGQWMLTGLGERDKNLYPHRDPRHTSVLLIQQGTNDLFGGNTAPYLYQNILKPFVEFSQAAGFYVAVDTILPRKDDGWMSDPAHERERLAYNDLVRANSVGADMVIDIAADPEIGDRTDPALSVMYADKVHPSRAGQERLAKIYAEPLGLMLQYPPRAPASR